MGGNHGLGRDLVEGFAVAGWNVLAMARQVESLPAAALVSSGGSNVDNRKAMVTVTCKGSISSSVARRIEDGTEDPSKPPMNTEMHQDMMVLYI